MNPEEFGRWVKSVVRKRDVSDDDVSSAGDAVEERLRAGPHVLDETVIVAVGAWRGCDYRTADRRGIEIEEATFPKTHEYIDRLLPLMNDRMYLKARVLLEKAHCYLVERRGSDSIVQRREALSLLDPLGLEIDLLRVQTMAELGGWLYAAGKKAEAEAFFLKALSYRWWRVRDAKTCYALRDFYVRAGRGLIMCRRGNLKALEDTHFVPAAMVPLGPPLRRAIEEAGGEVKSEAEEWAEFESRVRKAAEEAGGEVKSPAPPSGDDDPGSSADRSRKTTAPDEATGP